MNLRLIIGAFGFGLIPCAAHADQYVTAGVGVCEVDSNNVLFSDCIAWSAGYGIESTELEIRANGVSSDIVGINGAAAAEGHYNRKSLGLHWVRPFDNGVITGLGAGVSRIDYRFAGKADSFDFQVEGDGVNYSGFVSAEIGYEWSGFRVVASYLQHPDQVFTANVGGPDGFTGEPRTYGLTFSTVKRF